MCIYIYIYVCVCANLNGTFFFKALPCSFLRVNLLGPTSRIIPFSKWLITMVGKSPNWGCSPSQWPKWLKKGVTKYLVSNWDDLPSTS